MMVNMTAEDYDPAVLATMLHGNCKNTMTSCPPSVCQCMCMNLAHGSRSYRDRIETVLIAIFHSLKENGNGRNIDQYLVVL